MEALWRNNCPYMSIYIHMWQHCKMFKDHPSFQQAVIGGSGSGYQGFYLAYWQNSCWLIFGRTQIFSKLAGSVCTSLFVSNKPQNVNIFKMQINWSIKVRCWNKIRNSNVLVPSITFLFLLLLRMQNMSWHHNMCAQARSQLEVGTPTWQPKCPLNF